MAKKKGRRVVIFILFKVLSFLIRSLPLRASLFIGKYLGRCAFYALRKERKKALLNLDIAYGDAKQLKEKYVITRSVFENLGMNLVEVVSLPKFNRSNIDNYISCNGIKIIEGLIKEHKGGIVLSAHFGNWELMAHYFAIKNFPTNVLARRLRMQQFEDYLDKIRKRNKVSVIYRDASAKEVISILKEGSFIGIMPDQDMDSVKGAFVDFFGKPAFTPSGPAVLSLITKSSIIPCFMVRKKFGHEILLDEPLKLADTGDKDKDILDNVSRYTKVIENIIRKHPEQWVWFHDRWKTRPY